MVTLLAGSALAAPESANTIPVGVTIKVVRIGTMLMVPGSNSNQPRDRIIFADTKGGTLYTSAQDTTLNQSSCVDEACTKKWPPFLAPANAKPSGDWTLVTRPDGAKQWAFRGKPLYTNADDSAGRSPTDAAAAVGARPNFVSSTKGHDVDGRQVVEIEPDTWMPLPAGIGVQEVRTAPGQVLVNHQGRALYMLTAKTADGIGRDWVPFEAPQISLPVGDFTVLARKDGVHQWVYKGRALYTFRGDVDSADSNGKYTGDPFALAFVMPYFTPPGITTRKDHAFGGLLTTTSNQTIYVRENGIDGADGAQRAERGNPNTGMTIGLTGCDAACEKSWLPILAPDDAMPHGYWSVYNRADGKKQWAYYGYAVYTMAGEAPGKMDGHLIYDDADNYDMPADGKPRTLLRLRWRVAPP